MPDRPSRSPAEPLSPLAARVDEALALHSYEIESAVAAIDDAVPGHGGLFDPRTTDDERLAAIEDVATAEAPPERVPEPTVSEATLYVDGSCHGNPGPAGAGAVIRSGEATLACLGWPVGSHVGNNIAEYAALKYGLDAAITRFGSTAVEVCCDSLTVIKDIWGDRQNAVEASAYRKPIENRLATLETHEWAHLTDDEYNPADALATVGADIAALGP